MAENDVEEHDPQSEAPSVARTNTVAVLVWLVAVVLIVAAAAAATPKGELAKVGAARTLLVANAAPGPWEDPETTPWLALGVVEYQPTYFNTLSRIVNPVSTHQLADAGPAVGDLEVSADAARREAERILGEPVAAQVRLGEGNGTSGGLIATLAFIGSSGHVDLAGCNQPRGCARIAATGVIGGGSDGFVRAVGGLDHKLAAAREAAVDIVFHPAGNHDDYDNIVFDDPAAFAAQGRHWDGTHTVVPVWTVQDALGWLCGAHGDPGTCALVGVAHQQ